MNKDNIVCVARQAYSEKSDYYPCDTFGLQMEIIKDLDNANPICTGMRVSITNTSKEDFKGIVHLKLMINANGPKFFMPGFMYNTNTAEKPSSGRKAFPRIKRNPAGKPESEFFMTRSDRLAEPLSIVYSEGKVRGIAASPYWVKENGKAVPISFEGGRKKAQNATFLQYGGFSCNINDDGKVSVGYTLGYEDAPLLFVQTANVLEREAIDDRNSFCIKTGETIEFPVIIYDYAGEDERAIYKAMTHVYNRFHEMPRNISGMDEDKALTLLSGAIRDNACRVLSYRK